MDLIQAGAIAGATLSIIGLIKAIFKGISVINRLNVTINDLKSEVTNLKEQVAKSDDNDIKQNNAIRAVTRQHIIEKTDEVINRGYILLEEIYCLRKLYENYKALGGNSTVDERYKATMSLPSKRGQFCPEND